MNAHITASTTHRHGLAGLSDAALLAGTRQLVAATNHTLAALLAHLAEVEARGIYRLGACASLYTYCVYELRMSEDAAFRRAKAARLCRKFPALYDAVARGELHLTGLLLLGPHLTDDNCSEVLARAKHRTKREIAKLVRELDPLPDVPARVEPLGPELMESPRNPTWGEFVASFAPVRELPPGERPADWLDEETDVRCADLDGAGDAHSGGADDGSANAQRDGSANAQRGEPPAPARPQRYKVQFTATQEYVELLERACDLLSHAAPNRSIEAVHLRALRELVERLEKQKYGATDQPRQRDTQREADDPRQRDAQREAAPPSNDPRQRGAQREAEPPTDDPRQRDPAGDPRQREAAPSSDDPRQRGTIPAAVRRAVRERDGARCSYVDARGKRCRETAFLELHHEQPFARGGPTSADNLTLRCRAHNALAAEEDFGRDFMQERIPAAPDG